MSFATIGGGIIVEERLQTELVEILFEIATKIRLDPDILPAWFYPDREATRGRNAAGDSRRSQFPMFHVLVQYVHHDGSVGDFARTALLYLTETASKFKPLENWMIESDLAPQMASGLGALYSRLSRQSTPLVRQASGPPIVTLSDYSDALSSIAEPPLDLQQDRKAFFSYLAFWQDTLNHCKSVEVSDTLLDHFQVLFVQQLLYPSLLESSDVEGGSTAAVVDHLSGILRALDSQQLVDRILRYLLASPNMPQHPKERSHRRQRMSVSRRKSMDHLTALAEVADSPSPNLFNLLDLMVMSLKSRHSGTVNACLKLLSVVIEKHHWHVLTSLFRMGTTATSPGQRSVKQLNNHLLQLFDCSSTMGKNPQMDDSYQGALSDGQVLLEQHSCLRVNDSVVDQMDTRDLSVSRDCKLFEAVSTLLRSFFANDTVTNLSLSQAILALTACEHINLRGWFLPSGGKMDTEETSGLNITFIICELVEQVRQWRSQFPEWDHLMCQRRFELAEDEPLPQPPNPRTVSVQTRDTTSSLRSASPSSTQSTSRPATPRGRKTTTTDYGSIDSAISMSGGNHSILPESILGRSPLRQSVPAQPDENDIPRQQQELLIPPPAIAVLKTQIQLSDLKVPDEASESFPLHAGRKQTANPGGDRRIAVLNSDDSGAATPVGGRDLTGIRNHVRLSHILTNAIILQEFILELAAIVQLRATFFDEVDFGSTVSD